MTEQKHTPGEWHWVIHDHSCASLGVGEDPGLGTPLVMSVSPCLSCAERANPKEWEWGRCCTPSEADARLIAAAPELLEALREAEEYFYNHADADHDETGFVPNKEMKLLTIVRAAIAKATGQ